MTTYFDALQGWLRDLDHAETDPAPLIARAESIVARATFPLDGGDLEPLGWAYYLTQGALVGCVGVTAAPVVDAIEAKIRRDMRYLDAALNALLGRPCLEICPLWRNHPPYEDATPEDLAPMAQRVARLCSDAHDLMHTLAVTYRLSDNPARAAEQAMDRADSKEEANP